MIAFKFESFSEHETELDFRKIEMPVFIIYHLPGYWKMMFHMVMHTFLKNYF